MAFENEGETKESINAWISEMLATAPAALERRLAQAERQGLWARVRALKGAVSSARTGNARAAAAALSICGRIQTIATVYELPEVHAAASAIAEAYAPGASPTDLCEAETAMVRLEKMRVGPHTPAAA